MADAKKSIKTKKVETMRDKAQNAGEAKAKPRRITKTASKVAKPVKAALKAGRKEYHLIPQSSKGVMGFFTKSRGFTPRYLRNSVVELKQVTWPNRKDTWRLMLAVFLFAFVFGLVIAAVDFGLDKLFKGAFL